MTNKELFTNKPKKETILHNIKTFLYNSAKKKRTKEEKAEAKAFCFLFVFD